MDIDLDADIGEGYGTWRMGDDREPCWACSRSANVFRLRTPATRFVMDRTVRMASARGVDGAHDRLPDRQALAAALMQVDPDRLAGDGDLPASARWPACRAHAPDSRRADTHELPRGALGSPAAANAASRRCWIARGGASTPGSSSARRPASPSEAQRRPAAPAVSPPHLPWPAAPATGWGSCPSRKLPGDG